MSARDEVLARIRTALLDRPSAPPIPRDYRPAGSAVADLDRFAERVADYRATVYRVDESDAAGQIAAALAAAGIARVVVPDGFPDASLPELPGVDILREPLTTAELDAADGTVTTCALAVAETGTIVLDGGSGQGRRALSLVPDYLLVVVRAEQVLANVPDAVARIDPARPLTWISGPSATSDIELKRVEGVHGPRTLDVVLVG